MCLESQICVFFFFFVWFLGFLDYINTFTVCSTYYSNNNNNNNNLDQRDEDRGLETPQTHLDPQVYYRVSYFIF